MMVNYGFYGTKYFNFYSVVFAENLMIESWFSINPLMIYNYSLSELESRNEEDEGVKDFIENNILTW